MKTELIKRYTYAVTQKLPESQRADIEKELEGLIEDMLADRVQDNEATDTDVKAVLMELGNPAALADKYRGYNRYLIGPEIFPTYMTVMKIVLMAIGIAMLVVFMIQTVFTPGDALDHFWGALTAFISACFQGFAWVTITFGIIEYSSVLKGKLKKEVAQDWSPSDLPELPDTDIRINRLDPILSIIFTMLFVAVLTSAANLLGVWNFPDGGSAMVASFLDVTVFRSFLPYIWGLAAITIAVDVVKLVTRRQTWTLVGLELLVYLLNFVLALVIFSNPAIWNPNFMQQIAQAGLAPLNSEAYQIGSKMWQNATSSVVYIIIAVFAIQVITTNVKALRKLNLPSWIRSQVQKGVN